MTPRLAALVRRELIRPDTGAVRRRGRLPLPPPADPRRRLRGAAESRAGGAARALRRLAASTHGGAGRAGRDPRLPPRAGRPLQARARAAAIRRWPTAPVSGSPPPAAARSGAGDDRAAAGLLERALELTRPVRLDVVLELDLAERDLRRGRHDGAAAIADAAAERARGQPATTTGEAARPCRRRLLPRLTSRPIRPIDELETARARRRCRCSSRQTTTPASCYVWDVLGFGVANCARPLRGLGARERSRRFATPAWPGSAASGLFRPRARARLRPAAGGRGAAHARRAPAREPASRGRCCCAPGC